MIAIPALELAPKVVEVGNCSGRNVDKFKRFGLTPVPAKRVAPPLVAECFANLECRVVDTRLVNKLQHLHPGSAQGLDRSGAEESQDHPPSRIRKVRCGWRDDQAEVEETVGVLGENPRHDRKAGPLKKRCRFMCGLKAVHYTNTVIAKRIMPVVSSPPVHSAGPL